MASGECAEAVSRCSTPPFLLSPALGLRTRESSLQRDPANGNTRRFAIVVSELQPGPAIISPKIDAPYDDNAYAVSEGKTLFTSMNCSGCHFQGGGGIGPPLMDDEWIYGSEPQQIFSSIADGRPNGMPAWKYRLSTQQIWELVSYVRSLSSLNPKGARGGRDDHMMLKTPEASTPKGKPKMSQRAIRHLGLNVGRASPPRFAA